MATGGSDDPIEDPFDLQIPSETTDFYDLLQIGRNASVADIKVAYKQQSLKYHPDKTLNTDTEDVMKRLNKAKTILLDEAKRAEYDDKLDGQGIGCDPKGFLPTGIRFSDILLQDFNTHKANFKAGIIHVQGENFEKSLGLKFQKVLHTLRPKQAPIKLNTFKPSPLETILWESNSLQDTLMIKSIIQAQQKLLNIISKKPLFSIFRKSKPNEPIINVDTLDQDEMQLLSTLFTDSPTSSKEQLRAILPTKGNDPKDQWMESCFRFLNDGSIGAMKAAMGCLMMTLLYGDDNCKQILDVAQILLDKDLPQLALPLVAASLTECKVTKHNVKGYIIVASALKRLADDEDEWEWEEKLETLQAAKEACSLAEQSLDKSMEMPKLETIKRATHQSLEEIKSFNNGLYLKIISLWSIRDYNELLTFITTKLFSNNNVLKERIIEATQEFLQSTISFVDKMSGDDQATLLLLQGLIKIETKEDIPSGLADMERAAWSSSQLLFKFMTDIIINVCFIDPKVLLFSMNSFFEVCSSQSILRVQASNNDRCLKLFFPLINELPQFPFSSRWPTMEVIGLNVRGLRKFENAVSSQVKEGTWNEWEAGLAYIDYIIACNHKAELTLCPVYASLWLYKYINANLTLADNVRYAITEAISLCLQIAQNFAQRLTPPMKLYVSRLSLGIILHTLQLTKKVASNETTELVIQLVRNVSYTCRFCPLWDMPIVPISEAALLNIKANRFHTEFLLRLQQIEPSKRPITEAELRYQLHENDLTQVYPLEDSITVKARAMEELLKEKGWSWNDVQNLMTSPLCPRDSEGWLVRRHTLGTNLEFAQIKGFKLNFNHDNPSIEVLVIPAKNGNGLFGHEDIHTLLDLHQEGREPLFFSLDPPSEMEHYHPFQQFRYAPNKIQNTSILHTMFETDYLMKSFSVGTEVSSKPPFKQRPCNEGLLKGLPSSLVEALKPVGERPGGHRGSVHRFWIEADEFTYCQESNRSEVTFRLSDVKMSVRNHPLIIGPDGKLIDTKHNDNPDSAESRFAADMTEAYDELSLHFPMFGRLRELAKLQFIGIVVASILITAKEDKDNPQVPDELLREIQRDARTDHRNRVESVISSLKQNIGIWPSVNDHSKVSSVVDRIYRDTLRKSNVSTYSVDYSTERDLKAQILTVVQEKFRQADNDAVTQIADIFFSGSKGRLSKSTLQYNVRSWLQEINSRRTSAETVLINYICSGFSPPTREDIKAILREQHVKKYNTVNNLLRKLKSTPDTYNASACNWVPAATYVEETKDTYSLCYGGVTLNPRIKEGYVLQLPRNVRSVRVKPPHGRTSTRSYHTSNNTYHAPNINVTAAKSTRGGSSSSSSGGGGSGRGNASGAGSKSGGNHAAAGGGSGRGGGGDGNGSDDEDGGRAEKENKGIKGVLKVNQNRGKEGIQKSFPHQEGKKFSGKIPNTNLENVATTLAFGAIKNVSKNKSEAQILRKEWLKENPRPKFAEYYKPLDSITPRGGGASVPICVDHPITENTKNLIYCVYCPKTKKPLYVGMTEDTIDHRMRRHLLPIRAIDTDKTQMAKYFNSEATIDDFRVTVLKTFPPGTSRNEIKRVETNYMEQLGTLIEYNNGGLNVIRSVRKK